MSWLRRCIEEDRGLALAVALHALVQLALSCWDLPSAHGWENDGIAPRDLFGGLAGNLQSGAAHRYPLFHYAIVGVLASPVLLAAAWGAPAWIRAALEPAILSVPVMTGVSLVAKLVSVVVGAVALLTLGRLGRRLLSLRAGRFAVACAVLNLSIAYYGRTSNLDGPYMMWGLLALDRLVDVVRRGAWTDHRGFALFVAAAVATKDQAYGLFVLTVPVFFVVEPALRPAWTTARRAHIRNALRAGALACAVYAALAGPLWNPWGFPRRLALLAGTNSQDWAVYAPGWAGLSANIADLVRLQGSFFWPWPIVVAAWIGVWLALRRDADLQTRLLRAMPLVAGLSFVISFTLLVRRSEHRFMLPLGFALSFYAGAFCDEALRLVDRVRAHARGALRPAAIAVGLLLLAHAARLPLGLALAQWFDGRREVEAWLADFSARHPGARIELHGPLVYLPRLGPSVTSNAIIQRVSPEPTRGRNPLVGATEVEGGLGGVLERQPDVIVVPGAFAERFREREHQSGAIASRTNQLAKLDPGTLVVVRLLDDDRLVGYQQALEARPRLPRWALALVIPPIELQGSVGMSTQVFVSRSLAHGAPAAHADARSKDAP